MVPLYGRSLTLYKEKRKNILSLYDCTFAQLLVYIGGAFRKRGLRMSTFIIFRIFTNLAKLFFKFNKTKQLKQTLKLFLTSLVKDKKECRERWNLGMVNLSQTVFLLLFERSRRTIYFSKNKSFFIHLLVKLMA